MPYYCEEFTVPAKTFQSSPQELEIEFKEKYINFVDIFFPEGCCNTVKVQVFYGIEQISPKRKGSYFQADGKWLRVLEFWTPDIYPFKLKFKAWSPEADYNHTLTIYAKTSEHPVGTIPVLLYKIGKILSEGLLGTKF
ncbi:MAG: hypothetical protein DRP29_09825 [Thermodesulfobacteriota bacterium]|nr:MAG: hypothetical protein DRP29_09825 [Thermodesulfobacteriota bacterium]